MSWLESNYPEQFDAIKKNNIQMKKKAKEIFWARNIEEASKDKATNVALKAFGMI